MKITKDELLQLIDDITSTMGELLVTHASILEGYVDQQGENSARQRIDRLKLKLDGEKRRLDAIRDANKRKAELEKLRSRSGPR